MRHAASAWFSVVVPSRDIRPAVTPIGREHAGDKTRTLGLDEPIERRSGADQGPEVGAPRR
jgi:hypothetical protein